MGTEEPTSQFQEPRCRAAAGMNSPDWIRCLLSPVELINVDCNERSLSSSWRWSDFLACSACGEQQLPRPAAAIECKGLMVTSFLRHKGSPAGQEAASKKQVTNGCSLRVVETRGGRSKEPGVRLAPFYSPQVSSSFESSAYSHFKAVRHSTKSVTRDFEAGHGGSRRSSTCFVGLFPANLLQAVSLAGLEKTSDVRELKMFRY